MGDILWENSSFVSGFIGASCPHTFNDDRVVFTKFINFLYTVFNCIICLCTVLKAKLIYGGEKIRIWCELYYHRTEVLKAGTDSFTAKRWATGLNVTDHLLWPCVIKWFRITVDVARREPSILMAKWAEWMSKFACSPSPVTERCQNKWKILESDMQTNKHVCSKWRAKPFLKARLRRNLLCYSVVRLSVRAL